MRGTLIAGALALAAFAAGLRWGAMVAGGADSYGYVSQAGLWPQGSLLVHQDVVRLTPWPDAAETWSPLGYRPSPHQRDALVPIYPPGLPLLMTLAQTVFGFCGAFLVVPLCGALTVWLTFVFGRRVFGGDVVALLGATLVATSPVFLYQLMNAMSDVPVMAFYTLALAAIVRLKPDTTCAASAYVASAFRRTFASGLAMSGAIAIRPNLAPLALVIAAWIWFARRSTSEGVRYELVSFGLGLAPSVAGLLWFDSVLYESPLVSGYGTAGDLYALGYLRTNLRQFSTWIAEVETPVVALAAAYLIAPRVFPAPKIPRARVLIGGSMTIVVLSYLFYRPFDAWWYLRFLLPMWPTMMLATAVVVDALVRRLPRAGYATAMTAIVALLAYHGIQTAKRRSVFDLGLEERRYVDVARFVRDHTEPAAAIFSVQHSGSLRLYAGRLTLKFDVLDPLWLDRAVEFLQSTGRHPYFVLDGGEVDAFRRRFGPVSREGSLDWPPLATLGSVVSIYDPIARAPATPLAIASTHGGRNVLACDRPQSWPPLLRMK
jgi:hypothetical protein